MLNLIVFVCGAALMSLELVAARVLAPYMGNSIYVWGSVISMVMVALSLGYWLGGQAADRYGTRRTLPLAIAAAALTTVVIPVIAEPVLPWAAQLGPRLGSLVASAAIFFVPALLLATVSPLGVQLAAERDAGAHVGKRAGGLYAVSTGGSIVGTLATSFWLIPLLSLEPLIVCTGFLLAGAALASLALAGGGAAEAVPGRGALRGAVAVAVAAALLGGFVLWRVAPAPERNSFGETVLFQTDTQYHRITVTEQDDVRHLRFDRSNQSAIDLADGLTSRIAYPNYMHLALALNPDAKRVLVLGLGGGAITKRFWHDYPEMTVDSVEIDPVVVDVAERYFGFPRDERLRVFTEDARRFVQASDDTYDIIIVDAYYADSLPFHLTTEEFLTEVKARMAPDGVLAYNVISAVDGGRSDLFRSMYRTANGVWDEMWVFPIGIADSGMTQSVRNIIVMATDAKVPSDVALQRVRERVDGRVTIEGFPSFADDFWAEPVPVADVPLLTDAHAPTDSLIDVQ